MDKAEERALEHYPSLTDSFDRSKRLVYRNGYHQAEKDLALTWEDVAMINTFGSEVIGEHLFDNWTEQQIYEEVLTRFKQFKEAKK